MHGSRLLGGSSVGRAGAAARGFKVGFRRFKFLNTIPDGGVKPY